MIDQAYEHVRTHIKGLRQPVPSEHVDRLGGELIELLNKNHEDADLMRHIVNVLGDMRCEKAIPVFVDLTKSEATPSAVKRACVNALRFFDTRLALSAFVAFLGLHLTGSDKWVRQLAAQNLTSLIRRVRRDDEREAQRIFEELRKVHLNSSNTFTRMNTVIVLRLLGDINAATFLKARLDKEKSIISENNDPGSPYVIREIEKALQELG